LQDKKAAPLWRAESAQQKYLRLIANHPERSENSTVAPNPETDSYRAAELGVPPDRERGPAHTPPNRSTSQAPKEKSNAPVSLALFIPNSSFAQQLRNSGLILFILSPDFGMIAAHEVSSSSASRVRDSVDPLRWVC
jgi:hypothetical protein